MYRFALILGLVGTLGLADDAFAGKAKGDTAAQTDPYAVPEMKSTQIPELDAFFEKAKAPIVSVIDTRKQVDTVQANFVVAMGLPQGTPFKDAVAELQKKGEGKLEVAMDKGSMPRLKAKDAVPSDVQTGIDAFNSTMDALDQAFTNVTGLKGELQTIATEAAALPAKVPDMAKSAGLSAAQIPKSAGATKANVSTINNSKDEVGKLETSLSTLGADVKATFGA